MPTPRLDELLNTDSQLTTREKLQIIHKLKESEALSDRQYHHLLTLVESEFQNKGQRVPLLRKLEYLNSPSTRIKVRRTGDQEDLLESVKAAPSYPPQYSVLSSPMLAELAEKYQPLPEHDTVFDLDVEEEQVYEDDLSFPDVTDL